MKKKLLILALVFSSALFMSTTYSNALADEDPNIELQKKNKEDSDKINKLHKEADKKNDEISQTEKKIQELQDKITSVSQKIAESETKLQKLSKDLVKIESELKESKKKEEKTKKEMQLRIQYMYENSNNNIVIMFFKENSFSDFLNGAEYKSRITDYDRKQLNEYKAIREEIESKQKEQKQIVEEQKNIQENLENDKIESEKLVEEHKQIVENNKELISNINEEIAELQKSIQGRNEEIQKNIAAAQAKLAELRMQQQSGSKATGGTYVAPPSNGKIASSGYMWPLPSNYTTISSPFSSGRRLVAADYVNGGHLGTDIVAPIGTPIYAARAGVVVWSNFDAVSGNMVCIVQDDGRVSRYAHMSSTAVGVNQTVSQGQVIGYVGMTGSATGPHLHFQVETDPNAPFGSTAFDPLILY